MKKLKLLLIGIIIFEILTIFYLLNQIPRIIISPTGKLIIPITTNFSITHCDLSRTRSEDKDLYVELIPNTYFLCNRDEKTIEIKINSHGFRDREFSSMKPLNKVRILAMGDSFTYGWGVSLEDTWPKNLENLLNLNSRKRFEVLNLGVPGYDIWNIANLLVKKALNLNPDLVIISFIENDVVPPEKNSSIDLYPEYVTNHTHRELYIDKSFSLIRNHFNGSIMIALWPVDKEYAEQLKELAKKHNITVCELREIYEKFRQNELMLDDRHPNELAYELISKKVEDCLIGWMGRTSRNT